MTQLGSHTTAEGNKYHLIYLEEEQLGLAIGPIPTHVGSTGAAVEVQAESPEEAKEKLIRALNQGGSILMQEMLAESGVAPTPQIKSKGPPAFTKRVILRYE